MTFDSIHECNAKIYKTGLVVLYKNKIGRSTDELKRAAQQKRHYSIRKSEVCSAALNLWQRKKYRIWFITVTFAFNPNQFENSASRIFNNWLKNLRTNYKVNNYLYVKEKGTKNKRIHYHLLYDSPRLNIRNLQSCFNMAVKNYDGTLDISSNSIRLGNNPAVYSIQQCSKYISKYISKKDNGEKEQFDTKAYGFTNEISDVCTKIDSIILERLAENYEVINIFSDCFYELYILRGFDFRKCSYLFESRFAEYT